MVAWMRSADAGGSPKTRQSLVDTGDHPLGTNPPGESQNRSSWRVPSLAYSRYGFAGALAVEAWLGLSFVIASFSVFWLIPDRIKSRRYHPGWHNNHCCPVPQLAPRPGARCDHRAG